MICDPCRAAARSLDPAQYVFVFPPNRNRREQTAENWHRQCEAPTTCPCHHEIHPAGAVIARNRG